MRLASLHPNSTSVRRGVAAVEFAVVLPLILILLLGTWQMGRLIFVNQVMINAAREGARLASQGQIINVTGDYTQITTNSSTPSVFGVVRDYMRGNIFPGRNQSFVDGQIANLEVKFQFIDGNTGSSEPWQGAKGQRFRVTVVIPWSDVRYSNVDLFDIGSFYGGSAKVSASVDWISMADDPFQVNTTIPNWNPSTN